MRGFDHYSPDLVGREIVSVSQHGDVLTLDDGTTIEVTDFYAVKVERPSQQETDDDEIVTVEFRGPAHVELLWKQAVQELNALESREHLPEELNERYDIVNQIREDLADALGGERQNAAEE